MIGTPRCSNYFGRAIGSTACFRCFAMYYGFHDAIDRASAARKHKKNPDRKGSRCTVQGKSIPDAVSGLISAIASTFYLPKVANCRESTPRTVMRDA